MSASRHDSLGAGDDSSGVADADGEGDPRTAELRANLAVVRARIAAACAAASRPGDAVTLVVVTKTHPAADVRRLAALGVTDVGENRDQEARPKHEACADLPVRWHFVGQLQTNKARSVAAYADVVESVDRRDLVTALAAAAGRHERDLDVLLQVSLDDRPGRGGAAPEELPALADAVASTSRLRLAGVMAVAPLGVDPAAPFARLAALSDRLRVDHPGASVISAGMSGDLEAAVAAGATHVRIGTAVLGARVGLG